MNPITQHLSLFGRPTFIKAVVKPPFRMIGNMPDDACFYYVLKGEVTAYTPTTTIHTATNEGLALHCGTFMNEYFCQEEETHFEAVAIHLNKDLLRKIYDADFPDFWANLSKIKPIKHRSISSSFLLNNYIKSLLIYFENPELVSDQLLKLKLRELIILLAKTDNCDTIKALIGGLFSPIENNFKTTIEANIYNNLSIEELAQIAGYSLSTFKREFAKHYGASPAKYIKAQRLAQASKLLYQQDLRISDIAYDCGFNDLASFSKSFLKAYGVSPSEYRMDQIDKPMNQINKAS